MTKKITIDWKFNTQIEADNFKGTYVFIIDEDDNWIIDDLIDSITDHFLFGIKGVQNDVTVKRETETINHQDNCWKILYEQDVLTVSLNN